MERERGSGGEGWKGGLFLALLTLSTIACGRLEPPAPDVAARIGEEDVRYSEFEQYLTQTAGDSEAVLASDVLSQLFDQFLDEKLLVRIASERGLLAGSVQGGGDPRRAIDSLLQQGIQGEPGEAEIARYYETHRQEFVRPERVRLRQILTDDRETAEKVVQQLAAGADFVALAKQVSRDPSASMGGYQGELAREDLPPAFTEVIFSLQPGEVSRVVPADYGFHIFQVTERLLAGTVPLEDARADIAERLRQEQADRLLADLVRDGRSQYNVTVHVRNLPFNYRGSYL
ncbi:MAG TPA: peptidyl-prolyl cis-trans isomerase [Thermoanaerobaculia bacterium]|nr:peptidyl-prolyl cis-trans isomerase [Thermoanaerobaculia bacterium]